MPIASWAKVKFMKWIGLTGGLGSGKSTVAEILRRRGLAVIDADEMAKLAVGPGSPALQQIQSRFGAQVILPDGNLNRPRLAEIVFEDASNLAALEAIIHPVVRRLTSTERSRLAASGVSKAFYDVPLLFEKQMQDQFDAVVVVAASEPAQVDRAMKRDGISREKVFARMNKQLPLAEKVRLAHHVLRNDGSLADLEKQVDELLKKL